MKVRVDLDILEEIRCTFWDWLPGGRYKVGTKHQKQMKFESVKNLFHTFSWDSSDFFYICPLTSWSAWSLWSNRAILIAMGKSYCFWFDYCYWLGYCSLFVYCYDKFPKLCLTESLIIPLPVVQLQILVNPYFERYKKACCMSCLKKQYIKKMYC